MILIFEVDKILEAKEYNGKKFYPFTIKNLQNKGTNKPQIINASVEIPRDCKQVSCELYYYKSQDDKKAVPKLVKFQPFNK